MVYYFGGVFEFGAFFDQPPLETKNMKFVNRIAIKIARHKFVEQFVEQVFQKPYVSIYVGNCL